MPICISRAVFGFSWVTTGPKTRRPFLDVGLQTNLFSIQGHLLHLWTLTFLSQIHPYAFPADEAFPSYHIKFGHMKT
ncbi:unnamed protein product, partial [Sphagnum jensenii]